MDDEQLRREFAALREWDRFRAPRFETVRARRTGPSRLRRRVLVGAAATVVLVVISLRVAHHPLPAVTLAEIVHWQPETDVLLNSPLAGIGDLSAPVTSLVDEMPDVFIAGEPHP